MSEPEQPAPEKTTPASKPAPAKGDKKPDRRAFAPTTPRKPRTLAAPTLEEEARYHSTPKLKDLDAEIERDRKSTRLNSSHIQKSRMPSSA